VTRLEEAVRAASQLGFPVALKALGPALLHKTERKAVTLNIGDDSGVGTAYADFATRFGPDMTAVLVQQMVPQGVEMIVGALHDPVFGPVVACGTGGVLVDVLADTAFRLHPLSVSDPGEMIEGLRELGCCAATAGRHRPTNRPSATSCFACPSCSVSRLRFKSSI
jgi:predicted ATP-grasp superfamily ATP-dependent carboligase